MRVSRAHGLRTTLLYLVTTVVAGWTPLGAQDADRQSPDAALIAIVGFENLGGDPALDWVGPGTMASISAELEILGFRTARPETVRAALSVCHALAIDGAGIPALVASTLGARWVIIGSYQRLGARLRLTAQLHDATTDEEVTVVRAEGLREDLFDLQDQLAEQLAARMGHGRVPERALPLVAATSGFRMSAAPIDGPPPPSSPAVIARDAAGRATIRAVRVSEPLSIDGTLDERVYQEVPALSDFIQTEPREGVPATEQTEVWILFDQEFFYVSARLWDSAPESEWVVNEMRRDSMNILQNENFAFLIDTFYDRRNGVLFQTNPIGGRMDGQVTDERNWNGDWNPIWDVQSGRFAGGWTVEAAIPFKSLRYRPGRQQVWGLQLRRRVRWKNELSYLTRIPASVGDLGAFQASLAATLVGIEVDDSPGTLEIKPYAITDVTSDRTVQPDLSNAVGADAGLDVKYGVTQNLVADLTLNTDFAQVEADEQQVNLTRFSLFFPEKREFFLENQGLFAFGGGGPGAFGNGDAPVLFYSRRIGLTDEGQEVPMQVGGRLTGRMGPFSLGVMNVQTGDEPVTGTPATNFSVVRVKRDLLRRSSIGAIFTGRSVSTQGVGSSETYGLDGTFSFYDNLNVNTYWARTTTPGADGDNASYRAQLDYSGDRYGLQLDRLIVGDDFRPEVGFMRREDFERSFGAFRFSPRPRAIAAIRKLTWEGRIDYFTDRADVIETRLAQGLFGIEFENSDQFEVVYTRSYEFLDEPFPIASDVTVPVGGYRFDDVLTSFTFGQQRRMSGRLSVQRGGFFSGTKTSVEFGMGGSFRGGSRLELSSRLAVEPGVSLNWIDLPEGSFAAELITTRTTYTVTPLMFISALVQYNSANTSLGANVRFRWEYRPGSELFVVYNEQRDTLTPRFPELENRAFVIKINRLFRY